MIKKCFLRQFFKGIDWTLFRPGESYDEFIHWIWSQSDMLFVCKCMETAGPIRDQEMAGIQWSTTKSWSGLGRSLISSPSQFELNPFGCVCLQMHINCQTNQYPWKGRNSAEHVQKLIRPLVSNIMSPPAKLELKPISSVSANAQKSQVWQRDQWTVRIAIPMSSSNSVGWGGWGVLACIYRWLSARLQ